jgi:hypothetical protein
LKSINKTEIGPGSYEILLTKPQIVTFQVL